MSTASSCGAQLYDVGLLLVRTFSGLGALSLCAPLAARMNAEHLQLRNIALLFALSVGRI
jgi:hypothetical protein